MSKDIKLKKITDYDIYVPVNIPVEMEIRILGAVASIFLGNKSVDYIIKKFRKRWEADIEIRNKAIEDEIGKPN